MSEQSFELDVILSAPPAKVYEALATEKGVKGWWTPDCEVGDGSTPSRLRLVA